MKWKNKLQYGIIWRRKGLLISKFAKSNLVNVWENSG
jgi:hypothetical protein